MSQFLTPAQLAQQAGVSTALIRHYVRTNRLPSVRPTVFTILIPRDAAEQWLASRGQSAEAPAAA
jgi:predicted site-specific integrase-resolvase